MNFRNKQNHNHFIKTLFIATFICFSMTACSDDDLLITNPPSSERGYLVSYSKTGSLTSEEIISINPEDGDISAYAMHDLDFYSVVYNSLHAGELLEVSGLVLVPKNTTGALDLIQHHHGTTIPVYDEESIPSNYLGGASGSIETYFIGATMTSNGYVVSMPDYVGYGASKNQEHPYTIHHELAEVSVDMLRATKQLLNELSISFSNNVHLTGWSEGGGAGLATHKYLEEKYPEEFNLKSSSLFAGPYDYFNFTKDVIDNQNQKRDELSIYSWSFYALNKYNESLNRNANSIWSYSVSDQLDALDVPSTKPSEVFQSTFLNAYADGSDTEFINAAKENSLIEGWVPQASLFFHSGTEDFVVPHYNSVNANEHFQSLNVNSTLYEYPGEDHYTPLYEYVTTTLDDFKNF